MKENDFKWLKKHPYKSQVGFMMFLLKSFCKKKKKKKNLGTATQMTVYLLGGQNQKMV